jgi:hypothetical protein
LSCNLRREERLVLVDRQRPLTADERLANTVHDLTAIGGQMVQQVEIAVIRTRHRVGRERAMNRTVRITLGALPPRAGRLSQEELGQVFGGCAAEGASCMAVG